MAKKDKREELKLSVTLMILDFLDLHQFTEGGIHLLPDQAPEFWYAERHEPEDGNNRRYGRLVVTPAGQLVMTIKYLGNFASDAVDGSQFLPRYRFYNESKKENDLWHMAHMWSKIKDADEARVVNELIAVWDKLYKR